MASTPTFFRKIFEKFLPPTIVLSLILSGESAHAYFFIFQVTIDQYFEIFGGNFKKIGIAIYQIYPEEVAL